MIEAPASKSFTATRASSERKRISPLVWMNLVCLDAPLVAISWQWLFARSFQVAVPPQTTTALFLTAWVIYLADRYADSVSLLRAMPLSLRQEFCLRHRRPWLVGIVLIALADVVVVTTTLNRLAITVGVVVALISVLYLGVNRFCAEFWRVLPLKEVSIGFIFAAGTMVGLLRGLTTVALSAWLCFACLCSLNCISIAVWERKLDEAQRRISIATAFPRIQDWLVPSLALLAVASLASETSRLSLCVAGSATFLICVHLLRDKIEANIRTALADLVLLTPLALFADAL